MELPVLAIERQRRMLDIRSGSGSAATVKVAKALAMSGETARRDSERLEAEGRVPH
jgi:DeoR/GlpR family transcriptional regulator of sugar metabolism